MTAELNTLEAAELSKGAASLFHEGLTREGYIAKLSEGALFDDALKYTAHTLGGRPCIEWALSCARQLQPHPKPQEQEAFTAVEKWLADPTDANRRTAKFASEKAQLTTSAGCLAMAVFFIEGSIAPPEREHVPVPPHVAEKLAASAVILAVVEQPKQAVERYQRCLELARDHTATMMEQ